VLLTKPTPLQSLLYSDSEMSNYRLSLTERVALWHANSKRCFFCTEYVEFPHLEIDHIVPESTPDERLELLVKELELETNFDLNSTSNLVPTHHNCNRRKANLEYPGETLRFYLGLWKAKQPSVRNELQRLERQAANEKLLTTLAVSIERNYLSLREVVEFIEGFLPSFSSTTSEPMVILFGVNVSELLETGNFSTTIQSDYASLSDWLEEDLMMVVRTHVSSLCVQTEASARNGETLSACRSMQHFGGNILVGSRGRVLVRVERPLPSSPSHLRCRDECYALRARSEARDHHAHRRGVATRGDRCATVSVRSKETAKQDTSPSNSREVAPAEVRRDEGQGYELAQAYGPVESISRFEQKGAVRRRA
jgi:hypothetical protein